MESRFQILSFRSISRSKSRRAVAMISLACAMSRVKHCPRSVCPPADMLASTTRTRTHETYARPGDELAQTRLQVKAANHYGRGFFRRRIEAPASSVEAHLQVV